MERPSIAAIRIGDWRVDAAAGQISRNGETARLDVRAMRLLKCLAERAGEVVSIDELLDEVWAGVTVSQDSVYQAVAGLRRQLGDDPKEPKYIATVPRLGYRMVAEVAPWVEDDPAGIAGGNGTAAVGGQATAAGARGGGPARSGSRVRTGLVWLGGATAICVLVLAGFAVYGRIASGNREAAAAVIAPPQRSIAVVPFLDLTEGMSNEEFADGMTEELIGRLSKVPGLRVPAPTQSFFYKGKQEPAAEMAKELGVVYLLDGSVRKSGKTVRVAARLLRAENGYVIWTESYDRPEGDLLWIQDDIAGEVTKALAASIDGRAGGTK